MDRPTISQMKIINDDALPNAGLDGSMIREGIRFTHEILDTIDNVLVKEVESCLVDMFALNNISSMIGNLFVSGIAKASNGTFKRSGSHQYQDLQAQTNGAKHVEVKVALETNPPKAHLAKSGCYLTCRYVLCNPDGSYSSGKGNRGTKSWIWEVRFGELNMSDFNISNTDGDSGKTAVINEKGMNKLTIVYADVDRCPYAKNGQRFKEINDLVMGL